MGFFGKLLGLAPTKVHTGLTLDRATIAALLPAATFGKDTYAQVRDDYPLDLCSRAHVDLSQAGIREWEPDATCTLFAANAVVAAAKEYYAAAFQDEKPAPALAVAEYWFHPDGAPDNHAIVVFVTPSGLRFVDPQNPGADRPMSATELASNFYCRFL